MKVNNYITEIKCPNCGQSTPFSIEKGIRITKYLSDEQILCNHCECAYIDSV